MKKMLTNKILDSQAIKRTVIRLAHEILEKNNGVDNLILVGILSRGEPLAHRLHSHIKKISGNEVLISTLDITFHRDDYRERLVVPQIKGTNIKHEINDKVLILVDDVLYTGRTIRAAMEELQTYGRPKKIQLAVLIDRGHREVPIRADFVGANIPTHEGEHVKVELEEVDSKDLVSLIKYKETK